MPSIIFTILGALWILAIGVGTFVLMQYEYTPGVSNLPSLRWPCDSKICPRKDGPTLIMFAHHSVLAQELAFLNWPSL